MSFTITLDDNDFNPVDTDTGATGDGTHDIIFSNPRTVSENVTVKIGSTSTAYAVPAATGGVNGTKTIQISNTTNATFHISASKKSGIVNEMNGSIKVGTGGGLGDCDG